MLTEKKMLCWYVLWCEKKIASSDNTSKQEQGYQEQYL